MFVLIKAFLTYKFVLLNVEQKIQLISKIYSQLKLKIMKKENCKIKITYVLSVTVFLLMTVLMGFECSKDKLAGISPARDIAGTWTTPASVNFYMTSDGCGTYARYNRTPIKLSWNITYISDTEVDVDISASNIGTTTQLQSNCGLPATLNFPLFYHGKVSASNLLMYVYKTESLSR